MTAVDALVVLVGAIAFALAGASVGGGAGAAVAGAVGAALGYASIRAAVRPFVAIAVIAGTAIGGFVGAAIARTICLPGRCLGVEIVAGSLTALGSLIGVGLVVALVTRSFDEYYEARSQGEPPKITGCGPGDACD